MSIREFSPRPSILFEIHFNIIPTFTQIFQRKLCMNFSSAKSMTHVSPNLTFLDLDTSKYCIIKNEKTVGYRTQIYTWKTRVRLM